MSKQAAITTEFSVSPEAAPVMRPAAARTQAAALPDHVRHCTRADLPQVAELFQTVFRKRRDAPLPELIAHLEGVYFRHPWRDDALPSLVLQRADGTLDGFIGVLPLQLEFRGQRMLGSVAGALMVRDPESRPLAAARLMRSHVAGPQAVSFGDTTNGPARAMWEKLGGHMLPLASMEWLKVLRLVPFGAMSAASHMPGILSSVARPVAAAIEWLGWTLGSRPSLTPSDCAAETVDDNAYLSAAAQVSARLDFKLLLDDAAGRWLLGMAAQKRKHGPLYRRVVANRAGKPIGCYLVYAARGRTAEVLQVVTAPRDAKTVFDDVFAFTAGMGCTAVRGRTQGPTIDALFRAGCLMRHGSATVFRTADKELHTALEAGHIALGGFFGETWTRLVSDEFGGSA